MLRQVLLLLAAHLLAVATAVELTFELPDNAKQCFHEEIHKDVKSTIEFQVSAPPENCRPGK